MMWGSLSHQFSYKPIDISPEYWEWAEDGQSLFWTYVSSPKPELIVVNCSMLCSLQPKVGLL